MTVKGTIRKIFNGMKGKKETFYPQKIEEVANSPIQETEEIDEQKCLEITRIELAEARQFCEGFDREHIWVFVAGQYSQDFRGNPKYLFVYINKYRPDIRAYWLCDDEETIAQVRALGFQAYTNDSAPAQYLINRTGVMVAEQVKFMMPEGLETVKYVNLWHGVGFKKIERSLFQGDIAMEIARKYVKRGTFYRDNQLMGVSCPVIEEEYSLDCGVDYDKFLRTGYARCLYQQNFEPIQSFEHDLRKVKGLSESAKLVAYTPTYRANLGNTFSRAIPDFDRLYEFCEEHNILFIFKVHPNMENEVGFKKAQETYGDKKHFWFWDNREDFYEIMDQMDLAILDQSSIISDMVAMGIPHYIRYLFDFEEFLDTVSTHDNFDEKTTGIIVKDFDHLLEAIETFEERDETAEIERLNRELWSYSQGKDDFNRIIETALTFEPKKRQFPTLYSFDIFDTVFSRKVLDPQGVFYGVREWMEQDGSFPLALTRNYPQVRHFAEFNVREYYSKTKVLRNSDATEITFQEIFDRIASVYEISDDQKQRLMDWELEIELDNVVPLTEQIDHIKRLLSEDNIVILISDMYLPRQTVQDMLAKADPVLATLPIFLSNEYGVLKTSQKLFFEVYKSFEPYYDFEKWIHYGDNDNADIRQARNFQISARKIEKPSFNHIQDQLVEQIGTYDAFQVAALQARTCFKRNKYNLRYNKKYDFVVSYIALAFVPYVDWVLRDAQRRGFQTLYFISRDGHHMKNIAKEIRKVRGLDIKIRYIYASRRTWRIPSFVDEIDSGFWEPYGSFHEIPSKDKLFKAMDLDEDTFRELFPYLDPDEINFQDQNEFKSLIDIFRNSGGYRDYLLNKAKEERVLVEAYLRQEIDPGEKFALVDFYGRGYTQDCFVNLWQHIMDDKTLNVPFYYSRTVLPTANHAIRYNFTTNATRYYFLEAVLANMPYKSIEEYEEVDGVIKPIFNPISCDKELFEIMEKTLPAFAAEYAKLPLVHPEDTDRLLFEFMLNYFQNNKTNPVFADFIGSLVDSIALYGKKREFAPKLSEDLLDRFQEKESFRNMLVSTSMTMSFARSEPALQQRYREMYGILPGEDLAGGRLLSLEEQEENKLFKTQFDELNVNADAFRELYNECVQNYDVEDKIVFVTEGARINRFSGLGLLREALKEQNRYKVVTICLGAKKKPTSNKVAKTLASARFILIATSIGLLCKTKFRDETREILLRENAFYLYNQGLAMNVLLKWKNLFNKLKSKNDVSVLQLPSPQQSDMFKMFFIDRETVDYEIAGCSVTDLYFDPDFKSMALEKMQEKIPETVGKKVILYMPLIRSRNNCEEWMDILDMPLLKKQIGDEYVILLHFNKKQYKGPYLNEIEIPGFSRRIDGVLPLRELMIASDVIIGDYRDTFFETPLLHKPAFSTAHRYEDFIKKRNLICRSREFERLLFCPVISSAEELTEHLHSIDRYDYSEQERFREEMLAGCDGNSINRVVEYLMNEASLITIN